VLFFGRLLTNILDRYTFFNFNLIYFVQFSCLDLFFRHKTIFLIFLAFLLKTIILKHEFTIIFLKNQLLKASPFVIILYSLINLIDVNHFLNKPLVFLFFCFQCLVISLGLIVSEFYNLVSYRFTISSYILNQFFLLSVSTLVQVELTTGSKYFG